jgi:WD40 repeat protein
VAIKEYFPTDQCTRLVDRTTIQPYSGDKRDQYLYGLTRFLDEAKALAQFEHHPCIVPIADYAEANGTAYLIMAYLDGVTLKQYLADRGNKISAEVAMKILMPVLDGLREVHSHGLLHRDISPDNIFITRQGNVKLLDFGAARYAIREQSQSLSMVLKPGYSPEEQYRSNGKQGPGTDIYAAAATFYKAITGITPPPAVDRSVHDDLVPPAKLVSDLPAGVNSVILKALAVKSVDRYLTVEEFQSQLTPFLAPQPQTPTSVSLVKPSEVAGHPRHLRNLVAIFFGVAVLAALALYFLTAHSGRLASSPEHPSHTKPAGLKPFDGKPVRTFSGHTDSLLSVAFSPGGHWLSSAGADTVRIWDTATGQQLRTIPGSHVVKFSPDGKFFAAGSDVVRIYDTQSRDWPLVRTLSTSKVDPSISGIYSTVNSAQSIDFSRDGSKVVVAEYAGIFLRIWEVATGRTLRNIRASLNPQRATAFSPDGRLVASGGDDYHVRIWDANTGDLVHDVDTAPGRAFSLQFSPDGQTLAVACDNRQVVLLIDVVAGRVARTLTGHTGNHVWKVAYMPDGGHLLSLGSGDGVRFWNTRDWQLVSLIPHAGHFYGGGFALSPDGKSLALEGKDHVIELWSTSAVFAE